MPREDFNPRKDEDLAYLAAALTAYALGLKTEAILTSPRRTPAEARARHIAMYLLRTSLGMSLSRISRAFNKDRTTVSYACHVVEDLRDDADFDLWLEQLAVGLSSVVLLQPAPQAA